MSATNYKLVPAGPETVKDSKTKLDKVNTLRIPVPSVNASDYPQFSTIKGVVKKVEKDIVVLDIPATQLTIPEFESWDAFTAEAAAMGKDAAAKALEAVNATLSLDAAAERRKVGRDLKVIPVNPADAFANVASATVRSFFQGVQRALGAKDKLDRATALVKDVDVNDPEALKAAFIAMRASLGLA